MISLTWLFTDYNKSRNSYSVSNLNYHKLLLTILNNKKNGIPYNSLTIGIPPQPHIVKIRRILIYVSVFLLDIRSHTSNNIRRILIPEIYRIQIAEKRVKDLQNHKMMNPKRADFFVGKWLFVEFKGWYNPSIKLAYKVSKRRPQGI